MYARCSWNSHRSIGRSSGTTRRNTERSFRCGSARLMPTLSWFGASAIKTYHCSLQKLLRLSQKLGPEKRKSRKGRRTLSRRTPVLLFGNTCSSKYRRITSHLRQPQIIGAYHGDKRLGWPMAYVIAEPCIGTKDTACVDACPVDCIHPKKDTTYDDGRPTFDTVPQLYIDPVECIDCGACVPVCPVSAIFALDDLPEKWKQYTELNESYVKAGKFTPEEFANHQTEK